jgi:uncharacterized protein YhjY with autotransporter beta-barrel domain
LPTANKRPAADGTNAKKKNRRAVSREAALFLLAGASALRRRKIAGGGTRFDLASGLGAGKSDLFQAAVYGRRQFGAAYLTAALAYGWQHMTTERTVTIAGTDRLKATFDAHTFAGRVEGGWRAGLGRIGVTPYAALQVTSVRLPAYSEQAVSGSGAFALSYSGDTDTQTRSELGVRLDEAVAMDDDWMLRLRGRAAWAHDYSSESRVDAVFQTLPGAFTVDGADPDDDALLASAEIALAQWLVAGRHGRGRVLRQYRRLRREGRAAPYLVIAPGKDRPMRRKPAISGAFRA